MLFLVDTPHLDDQTENKKDQTPDYNLLSDHLNINIGTVWKHFHHSNSTYIYTHEYIFLHLSGSTKLLCRMIPLFIAIPLFSSYHTEKYWIVLYPGIHTQYINSRRFSICLIPAHVSMPSFALCNLLKLSWYGSPMASSALCILFPSAFLLSLKKTDRFSDAFRI